MDQSKYRDFQLDDFLRDESFRRWALSPDPTQWQEFVETYPDQRALAEEARLILQALQQAFLSEKASPEEIALAFSQLKQANGRQTPPANNPRIQLRQRKFLGLAVAAVALLLLSAALWIFFGQATDTPLRYVTDFGERRSIELPDGSRVQLNANSTLSLSKNWQAGQTREVHLEGEAFFSVQHQADHSKFIVRAGGLNVEVLGTQFNVNSRNRQTRVVLEEGKVRLDLEQSTSDSSLVMSPGEIVEYNAEQHTLNKRSEDTQAHTSWKDGVLVFEATSLAELARRIEEIYGVEVRIENPSLEDQTVKLFAPIDDFAEFIETLRIVLDGENIEIKRVSDQTLLIR